MRSSTFAAALAALLWSCPALSAHEVFPSYEGVKPGKIVIHPSETKAHPGLERAIGKAVAASPGEEVQYLYNYIQLAPRGRQVFVVLPGANYSGTGGSTALIFDEVGGQMRLISKFTLVNPPVVVANSRTRGWKDLLMLVSGGGVKPFYAHLKFNGKGYPSNPSTAPHARPGTLQGEAIVGDPLQPGIGLKFKQP